LTRILEVLSDCETRLRDAASKRILIEVALLKAIESRNATSLDTVLKQLQQLRGDDAREIVSLPMPEAAAPPHGPPPVHAANRLASPETASAGATGAASPPPPFADVAGPGTAAGDLEQLWQKVVEAVGRVSPFTRSYFLEAHPVSFGRNV